MKFEASKELMGNLSLHSSHLKKFRHPRRRKLNYRYVSLLGRKGRRHRWRLLSNSLFDRLRRVSHCRLRFTSPIYFSNFMWLVWVCGAYLNGYTRSASYVKSLLLCGRYPRSHLNFVNILVRHRCVRCSQ